jgi:hypothetical protein
MTNALVHSDVAADGLITETDTIIVYDVSGRNMLAT